MSTKRLGSMIFVGTAVFVARVLSGQHDVSSQRYLSQIAAEISKELPLMADEITEFYSIEGEEGLLSINYRIVQASSESLASADFDDAWAVMEAHVIDTACNNEDFRVLLDGGVTLMANYADSNYVPLESFDVVKSDCL